MTKLNKYLAPALFFLSLSTATAQNTFKGLEPLFTVPKHYVIKHTKEALQIDGRLSEGSWERAPWIDDFQDIEGSGKPKPAHRTAVKMLWSDSLLYIAARLEEPQVWATQLNHDDIIYRDNDFEVFIDPNRNGHDYFELEVNAFNKILDLFMNKPYRVGGNALMGWDVRGLQTAVHIDGTLNQPSDTDKNWTVEMAIPLKALHIGHPMVYPKEGSLWRINFSRVHWDTKVVNGKNVKLEDAKGNVLPEHNWVWSPQGVIDMHYPERWAYLFFTKEDQKKFTMPYVEQQKPYLWLVYYRQKEYFKKWKKYARTLKELGMMNSQSIGERANQIDLQATDWQFSASIQTADGAGTMINEQGLISNLNTKR